MMRLAPKLNISHAGRRQHRRIPSVDGASFTIGQTSPAGWVIDDPSLCPLHVKFSWMQVGTEFHMLIEKLSAGQVLMNGAQAETLFLKDGDLVTIGEFEIQFIIDLVADPVLSGEPDEGSGEEPPASIDRHR